MEPLTVLLILLSALAAAALVWFQYYHKNPKKGLTKALLASLRFISVFCGLLLLINPKFVEREQYLEKAELILLVDRSTSMDRSIARDELSALVGKVGSDPRLQERFNIHQFGFGGTLFESDSLESGRGNTDIANALSKANGLFLQGTKALVLFTDGNQTLGRDYEYLSLEGQPSVFPVVLGDTTQYEDISIGLLNVNTYAFLGNKFPVEASIRYQGSRALSQTLTLSMDGKRVHRQRVELDGQKNVQTLDFLLEAPRVGPITLVLEVEALENEKNKSNNRKEVALEVIDERSEIVLVTDLLHPDIGALKKAIESNEQRQLTVLGPRESPAVLENADILILYQPNRNFKEVYDFIQRAGINHLTINGRKTDWNYLNGVQESFAMGNSKQPEEIIGVLNRAFGKFGLGDFQVAGFPPLEGTLGEIELKKEHETILFQQIRGVDLDRPLLSILTDGNKKEAVLFGENIWRWRAQTYRNDQNFQMFDDFMGQLMLFLGSDRQKNRLEVTHPPIFENANFAKIRASYFDLNYQFDPRARISIEVEGQNRELSREYPLLLKNNHYEVDLSDLRAGEYRYTLEVEGEDLKRLGSFKILDFDPEQQFVSSDHRKLQRLAQRNKGTIFYPDQVEGLIAGLAEAPEFVPIQKSRENIVSLIDYRLLLGLIVLALTAEWFLRKYNGLI